jgi:hypothetical protein
VNAAEIPEGQPGVGYLLAGREPRKMRTYFISPEQALEVASRVARAGCRWSERDSDRSVFAVDRGRRGVPRVQTAAGRGTGIRSIPGERTEMAD